MTARDKEYDTTLLRRAQECHRASAAANWSLQDQPSDLLVHQWVIGCSGPGHSWVLDDGNRFQRGGLPRSGPTHLHVDGPLDPRYWITAVRLRLLLPLGELMRVARSKAGCGDDTRTIPFCRCHRCSQSKKTDKCRLDIYGMHLSSMVNMYTTRHNHYRDALIQHARAANIDSSPEVTFLPSSISASTHRAHVENEKNGYVRRVDALFKGIPWKDLNKVDSEALTGLDKRMADQHGLWATVDLSFYHPGAKITSISTDNLPMTESAGQQVYRLKVQKYRHITTDKSKDTSSTFRPQIAFLPMPFSIMGRMHPTTEKMVDYLISSSVKHRIANAGAGDILSALGIMDDYNPSTNRLVQYAIRSARCTLSTLIISSLVSGMFEQTGHARSSPPSTFTDILSAPITTSTTTTTTNHTSPTLQSSPHVYDTHPAASYESSDDHHINNDINSNVTDDDIHHDIMSDTL